MSTQVARTKGDDVVKNIHKVPKKLWNKFGPEGQALFSELSDRLCCPDLVTAAATPKMSHTEWETLRHNICVEAAWALKGLLKGKTRHERP